MAVRSQGSCGSLILIMYMYMYIQCAIHLDFDIALVPARVHEKRHV